MSEESNGKPADPDVLVVKSRRRTKKVRIEDDFDAEPGTETGLPAGDYVLRELIGTDRDEFVDLSLARAKRNETGAYIGYQTRDLEAILVHKCLFDKDGKQLPIAVIKGASASTLTALYLACEELCALNKVGVDKAKKA